jgi:hypothetical protein
MAIRPTSTLTTSRLLAGAMALLATLALAATAAAPASAEASSSKASSAAQPTAFALSPVGSAGALLLRGRRGGVLRGAVIVRNVSGHRITVFVERADIQTASNGNASYVTKPLSRIGRWLHLAARSVRLAPHASRRVAFTVRIPKRIRGASHYLGIVAINAADFAAGSRHGKAKRKRFTIYRIDRQALPLTIRLPGPLTRHLALRSAQIIVQPAGAGLVLGLLPRGGDLIEGARVKLRVSRGARTVFVYTSTLGQLFPSSGLNYRIPWRGRPTPGTYRVTGVIRPVHAAAVRIDRRIGFTRAKAIQLERGTPAAARTSSLALPPWIWAGLGVVAALLLGLSAAVWKLARRPLKAIA